MYVEHIRVDLSADLLWCVVRRDAPEGEGICDLFRYNEPLDVPHTVVAQEQLAAVVPTNS